MENEPIRVLHIVPNMQAGGLETLIMNIYRNIDRTKVQFDFLVHYTGNYFYDDEIRSLGGRIYKLSVRDDNNFIKYLKDLDAFFKKHPEYKIVHGHMESLGQFYFKAAKKDGVPVRVAHSHNSATENTFKGKIKGLLLKRYKVFATDYFACSQKAGEFMFANKKFTVLKNAIIVNNFIYNENERNRLRKELGIEGKIVIGHAGRFCEQKNHKFLIDVFKKIADLENNAVLLLIGAGETFEKVKEQVCEYGLEERVIFLGVRKDINLSDFYPDNSMMLKEKYGITDKIILGVAAVWSNRKGLSTFIELERKLPKGYKIVLIGLNDRQIKELPKGILGLPKTFSVDELRNWYSCAEVFVNPTMEEVLGLVNIEAQACGTPVITYDTGGSVECVSNDTGFIVEQNNVHQLICKIETICEVSKSNYKLACITQSKNFDKDKKYMEYVELYEKIFNQSRRKS